LASTVTRQCGRLARAIVRCTQHLLEQEG
jgi:hypothetical protein